MFCPFMSTATTQVPCTPNCALALKGGCAYVVTAKILDDISRDLPSLRNNLASISDQIRRSRQ